MHPTRLLQFEFLPPAQLSEQPIGSDRHSTSCIHTPSPSRSLADACRQPQTWAMQIPILNERGATTPQIRRQGGDWGGDWAAEAEAAVCCSGSSGSTCAWQHTCVSPCHGPARLRLGEVLLLLPLPLRIGCPPFARLCPPGRFLDTGCALEGGCAWIQLVQGGAGMARRP